MDNNFSLPKCHMAYKVDAISQDDEVQILEKINTSIGAVNTDNCILLGDFNGIDWDSLTSPRALDTSFIDTVTDNLLTQMVTEPTRSDNILDLALVGDTSAVLDCKIGTPFSTSNHRTLWLQVNCPIP
jgi:hypothetical protein